MNKENYIKSLEGFMLKVAKKVKCLPDFTDPANENDHILRAIEQLQNTSNNSDCIPPSAQSGCSFCDGSGEDEWNERICPECRGTGEEN